VTPFTYHRWRKEFGGLKSDQVRRLKELEKETSPSRRHRFEPDGGGGFGRRSRI
jgi:hypothetical protein